MDTQLQIQVLARRSRWNVEQIGRDFAAVIRYGFAALFIVTGVSKLLSGEAFVEAIRSYGLAPHAMIDVIAGVVIVSELALGVWLASGRARRAALWTVAAALLGFGAIVAVAAWRGAMGDCGCFAGVAESSIGLGAVLRTAALAAVAINAAVITAPRNVHRQLKEKGRC